MSKSKDRRRAPAQFAFVAPRALADCAQRLTELEEQRHINFVPRVKVERQTLDDDTIAFTLTEQGPGLIRVTGHLKRLDQRTTHVSGHAKVLNRTYVEWLPFAGIALALTPIIGVVMSGVFVAGIVVFSQQVAAGSKDEQSRLVDLTRDTLMY